MAPEWARELIDAGELPGDWAAVFRRLPRALFLPDLIWPLTPGGYVTVDRRDDPEAWDAWATSDVAVVTQWDDGNHTGREPGHMATSSASQPSLVARMLADLDVRPGHRVLDVGAGTGWTMGLLTIRAGAGNVTGVEVDARIAAAAAGRLRAAGIDALVAAADGDQGWPGGAPYDRIHGTFAVRHVPAAWIEQTRPGGLIVVPWGTRYSNLNAVARLTVAGDGTASGRFTRPAEFMLDRHQRGAWPDHGDYIPGGRWPADTRESTTGLRCEEWAAGQFVIGLCVHDVAQTVTADEDDASTLMLYGLTDRSWAAVYFCSCCDEADVFQGGPRSLWDEVEAACRWWSGEGFPGVDRFGLTISPDGDQTVWFDAPDHLLRHT